MIKKQQLELTSFEVLNKYVHCIHVFIYIFFFAEIGEFKCGTCNAQYETSKNMMRHLKFAHKEEENFRRESQDLISREAKRKKMKPSLDEQQQHSIQETSQAIQVQNIYDDNETESMRRESQDLTPGEAKRKKIKPPYSPDRRQHSIQGTSQAIQVQNTYDDNETDNDVYSIQLDFVCNVCDKAFSNSGTLMVHQKFHESTIREYKCDSCNFACNSFQTLTRHKTVHFKKSTKCELCGNVYRKKYGWTRHLENGHGIKMSKGQFLCSCGELFQKLKALQKHGISCEVQQKNNSGSGGLHVASSKEVSGRENEDVIYHIEELSDDVSANESEEQGSGASQDFSTIFEGTIVQC